MRRCVLLLPIILVGVTACCSTAWAATASVPKLRAVLWIGGIAHDFETAATILVPALEQRIPSRISVVRDGSFLDAVDADQLDLILMHHCFKFSAGVVNARQRDKLLALIRGGVGAVAIHASYYSFVEWDAVRELYGARFTKHGAATAVIEVRRVDAQHPITKDTDATFEVVSELYQSTPLAADCHVLARAKERGTTAEYPSVWTRRVGEGRVVTILPGHWPDSFRVAGFQELIAASARWAANRTDAMQ